MNSVNNVLLSQGGVLSFSLITTGMITRTRVTVIHPNRKKMNLSLHQVKHTSGKFLYVFDL